MSRLLQRRPAAAPTWYTRVMMVPADARPAACHAALGFALAASLACQNDERPSTVEPSTALPSAPTPAPQQPKASAPQPPAATPTATAPSGATPPATTPPATTPPAASAEPHPAPATDVALAYFRVRDVAAGDALNIRSQPDSNGRLLGSIPPSAERIEGIGPTTATGSTRWQRVRHAGTIGWVNARFLAPDDGAPREPPPALASAQHVALLAPLACFGTEPFWDVRFAPDGGATCGAMCEGPPGLRLANVRTNASGEPESFELLGAEKAIWLRAAMRKTGRCSDGMSDLVYPYEFEGIGAPGVLSGCCRNPRDAERGPRP